MRVYRKNSDVNILVRVQNVTNLTPNEIAKKIGYGDGATKNWFETGMMPEVAHQACLRILENHERSKKGNAKSQQKMLVAQVSEPGDAEMIGSLLERLGVPYKWFTTNL